MVRPLSEMQAPADPRLDRDIIPKTEPSGLLPSADLGAEVSPFSAKRCSLCGAVRLKDGVCSLVPGPNGQGGCPDPTYDLRREERHGLPSSQDLDLVAEELRVAEATRRGVLKVANHTCCTGVDVPGVGLTHSHDCLAVHHCGCVLGRDHVPGLVPEPLHEYLTVGDEAFAAGRAALAELDAHIAHLRTSTPERERLLVQLLFAARELAQSCIDSIALTEWGWRVCKQCGVRVEGYAARDHKPTCSVKRVLDIVDQLLANVDPNGKEAAPDGGAGCAGDGIRSRGAEERVCGQCGKSDGYWERIPWPKVMIWHHEMLSGNQFMEVAETGNCTLITHFCGCTKRPEFLDVSLGARPGHGVDALFAKPKGGAA